MRSYLTVLCLLVVALWGGACSTTSTFPLAARAGDTVIVPIGWNKTLSRQNTRVVFQPATGSSITYAANHPGIRGLVNLYPDPVSRLVIGTEIQQGYGLKANEYGNSIASQITSHDKDWWQTVLYVDLPVRVSPGRVAISVLGPEGSVTQFPLMVDVLPGTGRPLDSWSFDGAADEDVKNLLGSLERSDHATLSFVGRVVPHSIQVELVHDSGPGKRWVTNPRGDLKNLSWSDNGERIRVLLTPSHGQTLGHLAHFKFYVSGNTDGLRVAQIRAYDINGVQLSGIQASIQ